MVTGQTCLLESAEVSCTPLVLHFSALSWSQGEDEGKDFDCRSVLIADIALSTSDRNLYENQLSFQIRTRLMTHFTYPHPLTTAVLKTFSVFPFVTTTMASQDETLFAIQRHGTREMKQSRAVLVRRLSERLESDPTIQSACLGRCIRYPIIFQHLRTSVVCSFYSRWRLRDCGTNNAR